jgi:hypothetical protein
MRCDDLVESALGMADMIASGVFERPKRGDGERCLESIGHGFSAGLSPRPKLVALTRFVVLFSIAQWTLCLDKYRHL